MESNEKLINSEPINDNPKSIISKIRYDWYQTDTHVCITILVKNVTEDKLKCDIKEKSLDCKIIMEPEDYELNLILCHPVDPVQSQIKILSTKVEIRLKKTEGVRWNQLHFEPLILPSISTNNENFVKYPSSSHYTRDWDKLVSDIKKEEKEEKPEGDAALNQLFQQIYSDGSDEVRKAMNKSFSESGGTVLSTNWSEIGKEKVEVKPPDGMEFKKWDS